MDNGTETDRFLIFFHTDFRQYTAFSGIGLLLSFFMKAHHLSKDHQEAHLGILNEARESDQAGEVDFLQAPARVRKCDAPLLDPEVCQQPDMK